MNTEKNKVETYIQAYADTYCNGDIELAKSHLIVELVKKHLEEGDDKK